jgi:hypothetical protein
VAVDERRADELLHLMTRVARRLRPGSFRGVPHSGDDSPWLQLVAQDVSFLLAEMASVDAVEEFLECDRRQGAILREMSRRTRARLIRWRDRARSLDASVRTTMASLDDLRPPRTADRVEGALARSIESVLSRELPALVHAPLLPLEGGAHDRPATPAPDDTAVTHEEEREFFDLNRVTRLLSDLARDYFARSLSEKSDHAPHVGLLLAFVQLLLLAKEQLNGVTERHLDFFYRDVLGLHPRGFMPDTGCVVLRLAPTVPSLTLPAGTEFVAERSGDGPARRYATTQDVLLTQAQVDAVRSVYVHRSAAATADAADFVAPIEHVFALPVANSADGLGAPLADPAAGWPVFGVDDELTYECDALHIDAGFVIVSPLFLMREGVRQVRITLTMDDDARHRLATVIQEFSRYAAAQLDAPLTGSVFEHLMSELLLVSVTGPGGYVDVPTYRLRTDDTLPDALVLEFTRTLSDPPMCLPEVNVEGPMPRASAPNVRIRLNPDARVSAYSWFARLRLARVRIDTTVRGLRSLSLQGPQGPLSPDAPLPIFGVIPERGSAMTFGNEELWNKRLTRVQLHVTWTNLPRAPETLASHYDSYRLGITSDRFLVRGAVLRDFEWHPLIARSDVPEDEGALVACFPRRDETNGGPVAQASWAWELPGLVMRGAGSGTPPLLHTAQTSDGIFRLELMAPAFGFAHQLYPRLVIDAASRWWPSARRRMRALTQHPPLTPLASRVALDYDATTSFEPSDRGASERDGTSTMGDAIWEIGPFGQLRPFRRGTSLVLALARRGYLFIGLTGVRAPERLSLFFHLRESVDGGWRDRTLHGTGTTAAGAGTAAIAGTSSRAGELQWRYLSSHGWRPLPLDAIASDDTLGLLRSGAIRLDLPPDHVPVRWGDEVPRCWLEVSVAGEPSQYGRVLGLHTQAVPLVRVASHDPGDCPPDAATLPAGRITRLATPRPQVAAVLQPAPTAGGSDAEDLTAFRTRVSERVRHGARAILPRDYESLVLDRFPVIDEVRCVTVGGGRVMVVVVPRRRAEAADARPAVSRAMCREIAMFLRERTSAFVRDLFVRGPWYETVRVSAWLRFHPGRRGDGLRAVHAAIESFLSPWRTNPATRLGIGTGVFELSELRSAIDARRDELGLRHLSGLSAVHLYRQFDQDLERTHWVIRDSVTHSGGVFAVHTPWSVFIPADEHLLRDEPAPAGVGVFEVGETFAISDAGSFEASRGSTRRRRDFDWPRVPAGVGNVGVGRCLVVQAEQAGHAAASGEAPRAAHSTEADTSTAP